MTAPQARMLPSRWTTLKQWGGCLTSRFASHDKRVNADDSCCARSCPDRTSHWDGVRNALAKKYMKEGMKLGDKVSEPVCTRRATADPLIGTGPLLPLEYKGAW